MELHWGWLVVIYLFLGGLGAGAFIASYAAEKGWLGNLPGLKEAGYYLSGPAVALGTVLLVFDLGQGLKKPWLIAGMLLNFQSVMTWGVWIISAFIIISLLVAFMAAKGKAAPEAVKTLGVLAALGTATYTGLLLSVIEAVPFWATALMPIIFLVSALSTGLSAVILLGEALAKGSGDVTPSSRIHTALIAAELALLTIYLLPLYGGSGHPTAVQAAIDLVIGPFAPIFWGLFIFAGLLAPLSVFAHNTFRTNKMPHWAVLLSDAGVLTGGLCLRYLVLALAYPMWNGIF